MKKTTDLRDLWVKDSASSSNPLDVHCKLHTVVLAWNETEPRLINYSLKLKEGQQPNLGNHKFVARLREAHMIVVYEDGKRMNNTFLEWAALKERIENDTNGRKLKNRPFNVGYYIGGAGKLLREFDKTLALRAAKETPTAGSRDLTDAEQKRVQTVRDALKAEEEAKRAAEELKRAEQEARRVAAEGADIERKAELKAEKARIIEEENRYQPAQLGRFTLQNMLPRELKLRLKINEERLAAFHGFKIGGKSEEEIKAFREGVPASRDRRSKLNKELAQRGIITTAQPSAEERFDRHRGPARGKYHLPGPKKPQHEK